MIKAIQLILRQYILVMHREKCKTKKDEITRLYAEKLLNLMYEK